MLLDGFVESAQESPQAPAIAFEDREVTYAQLDYRARTLASALLTSADAPPQRVGVLGGQNETTFAGILAALFCGAGYVPLASDQPPERIRLVVESAKLDALIVAEGGLSMLDQIASSLSPDCLLLLPDSVESAPWPLRTLSRIEIETAPPLSKSRPATPSSLAYLMFTSGSTGRPKGVPISHANIDHLLDVCRRRYPFLPDDRLSQLFSLGFDLSVFNLFMAWGAGACLCPLSPVDVLLRPNVLRERGITAWFSVPTLAQALLGRAAFDPDALAGLRWSLFCGEPLLRSTAQRWQEAARQSVVENLYGPTELTVACSAYRLTPDALPDHAHPFVPIGELFDRLTAVVVDEQLHDAQQGSAGELCVGGPQAFGGYWGDQAGLAVSFIQRAVAGQPMRFYRTGDLVAQSPGHGYVYLGRIDDQVKIRGVRVELAEIEAVLRSLPGVDDAVVVPWPVRDGIVEGTVAFVTGDAADLGALRQAVALRFPPAIAPAQIVRLQSLPTNANGKIDRRRLATLLDDPGGGASSWTG